MLFTLTTPDTDFIIRSVTTSMRIDMELSKTYRCYNLKYRLFLLVAVMLSGVTGGKLGDIQEYCVNDVMEAKCKANEVIVMKTADYGRMHIGRCAKKDYGFIGCTTNVLGVTDFLCSGRHTCSVNIPNTLFDAAANDCPDDFQKYLEASYSCVRVTTASRLGCRNSPFITLSAVQGVLASVHTTETGCGAPSSPWIVRAKPGQRINVTLIDFYYGASGEDAHLFDKEARDLSKCVAYAILKETEIGRTKTLCARRDRVSHAYISTTHQLQIGVIGGNNVDAARYFLLNYTVVGCITPPAPDAGWLRQEVDRLEWGCNGSSQTHTRQCEDGNWLGETPMECTSTDLAIAMIVGIALIIASIILCVGVVWLKRSREDSGSKQLSRQAQGTTSDYDNQQQYMTQQISNYSRKQEETLWAHYDQYRNGENIYASIQEAPTLPMTGRKLPTQERESSPYPQEGFSGEPQSTASTPYSTLDNDTFHTFHFPPAMGTRPNAYSDAGSEHYKEPSRQFFMVDPLSAEGDVAK